MKTVHHLKIKNNILTSEIDNHLLGAWLLIFKMTKTAVHIHECLFSGDCINPQMKVYMMYFYRQLFIFYFT